MNEQKQQLLLTIDELERKRGLLLTLQASINSHYKQLKRALLTLPSGYNFVAKRKRYMYYTKQYFLPGSAYNYETNTFPIYTRNPVGHLINFINSELLRCNAVLKTAREWLTLCQTL